MDSPNNYYTPTGSVPPNIHLNTHTLPIIPSITSSTNIRPHQSSDGINCARETCKSKSGMRTKGHKECTEHLCKRCCQEAASLARNNGAFREPCHEPKHRLRTIAGSLAVHQTLEPVAHGVAPQIPPGAVSSSAGGAPTATHYAMPLATMWQPASDGWLANRQQAAKAEDDRRSIKKLALESQQARGLQITMISWTQVSFKIS